MEDQVITISVSGPEVQTLTGQLAEVDCEISCKHQRVINQTVNKLKVYVYLNKHKPLI